MFLLFSFGHGRTEDYTPYTLTVFPNTLLTMFLSRLSFLILPPLISFIFSFLFPYSSMQYKLFVNCEESAPSKLYMLCYMRSVTLCFSRSRQS